MWIYRLSGQSPTSRRLLHHKKYQFAFHFSELITHGIGMAQTPTKKATFKTAAWTEYGQRAMPIYMKNIAFYIRNMGKINAEDDQSYCRWKSTIIELSICFNVSFILSIVHILRTKRVYTINSISIDAMPIVKRNTREKETAATTSNTPLTLLFAYI